MSSARTCPELLPPFANVAQAVSEAGIPSPLHPPASQTGNSNFFSIAAVMRLAIPRAARGKDGLEFSEKSPGDQCTGTSAIALVILTECAYQHGIFHSNPIAISRARHQD